MTSVNHSNLDETSTLGRLTIYSAAAPDVATAFLSVHPVVEEETIESARQAREKKAPTFEQILAEKSAGAAGRPSARISLEDCVASCKSWSEDVATLTHLDEPRSAAFAVIADAARRVIGRDGRRKPKFSNLYVMHAAPVGAGKAVCEELAAVFPKMEENPEVAGKTARYFSVKQHKPNKVRTQISQ